MPDRAGSTSSQLGRDIDSGRTGDKTPGFDPAAAPLGTDDEAGGAPPTPEDIDQARRAERRRPARSPNAAEAELQPDGQFKAKGGASLFIALAILAALVLAAAGWAWLV